MARSLSDMSLADLQSGLSDIRSAMGQVAVNGGVVQYSINGRSGTYGIEMLERWERNYVSEINRRNGRRRGLRRAVPVDIR
jgi:hypothetical protein